MSWAKLDSLNQLIFVYTITSIEKYNQEHVYHYVIKHWKIINFTYSREYGMSKLIHTLIE